MEIDKRKVPRAFQKLSKRNQEIVWDFILDHYENNPEKLKTNLNDIILESAKIKDNEKQTDYLVENLLKLSVEN